MSEISEGMAFHTETLTFTANSGKGKESTPTIFDDYSNEFTEGVSSSLIVINKRKYVTYGKKNQYPEFLKKLAMRSGLHSSIMLTKTNLTTGEGLAFKVIGGKEGEANDERKKEAEDYLKGIGVDYKLRHKISWDQVLYGGVYVQEAYGQDTNGDRILKRLWKERFEHMRIGKSQEIQFGRIVKDHYQYNNWTSTTPVGKRGATPIMTKEWAKENNIKEDNLSALLYMEHPTREVYPRPDYESESGIMSIMLDSEITLFDVAELKNGLNAAYIVTFMRNDYTQQNAEKEKQIREEEDNFIRSSMTGAANNSRVIVRRVKPNKAGGKPMDIEPIPSHNTAERHSVITKRKDIGILTSHGLPTPELGGIPDLQKGGLSSQAEKLITALEIFHYNRIKPNQRIQEEYFNEILKDGGIDDVEVNIINSNPVSRIISDALFKWAFTENEIREFYGVKSAEEDALKAIRENRAKENSRDFK